MTLAEAIDITQDFNDWRRSAGRYADAGDWDPNAPTLTTTPGQLGEALDVLLAHARKSSPVIPTVGGAVVITDYEKHGVEVNGRGFLIMEHACDADREAAEMAAEGKRARRFTDRHTVTRAFMP